MSESLKRRTARSISGPKVNLLALMAFDQASWSPGVRRVSNPKVVGKPEVSQITLLRPRTEAR
jgi:hypothetical protein